MKIQRFFAYAENARALLRKTLTAYLIGAKRCWALRNLCEETPPPRYEEQAAETLEKVVFLRDTEASSAG